jgi:acyl-CoA synthetase (AMP-forming)/AMP-acid ligase II
MPTSGSTGRPSLVSVTDANLFANTADIVESQSLTAEDRALLCLPLSYCFGASVLHTHLWAGGSVVTDDRLMFPEKVLDTVESERCTTFAGVPTSFHFLKERSSVLQRKFSKLRLWLQAGGHLSSSVVHSFRNAHPDTDFLLMYGQTEATARIASFVVEGDYPRGCVGYPMSSIEIEIRGEGRILGFEEEGEICIRGKSVTAGYYGDAGRDEKKFKDGWLKTGDIGHLLQDGRLCITGRSEGFIKIRGRRVSTAEIEEIIWRELEIRCCACAIPDPSSGEVIGLLLEERNLVSTSKVDSPCSAGSGATPASNDYEGSVSGSETFPEVRKVLPQHWDVGPVVFGKLPLTLSGKVNRNACRRILTESGGNLC